MTKSSLFMKNVLIALTLLVSTAGFSADKVKIHKVAIQVSSADPLIQKIALNNAANVQKHYGTDNVIIEIVAYGPGLSLLTKKNPYSKRVESMAISEIRFKACNNTIKAVTRKKGKKPVLTPGVKITPSGVVRLMELQEQGYSYIRP